MQRVRLYGKGAVTFHNGKEVIRTENGHVDLPALLVPQALSMGFTREPTGPDSPELEEPAPLAKIESPSDVALVGAGDLKPIPQEVIDAAQKAVDQAREDRKLPLDKRTALYREQVETAGYKGDALDAIVAERLRFDELIAEGKSEEDAAAIVWGGGSIADQGVTGSADATTKVVGETQAADVKVVVDANIEAAKTDAPDARLPKTPAPGQSAKPEGEVD